MSLRCAGSWMQLFARSLWCSWLCSSLLGFPFCWGGLTPTVGLGHDRGEEWRKTTTRNGNLFARTNKYKTCATRSYHDHPQHSLSLSTVNFGYQFKTEFPSMPYACYGCGSNFVRDSSLRGHLNSSNSTRNCHAKHDAIIQSRIEAARRSPIDLD